MKKKTIIIFSVILLFVSNKLYAVENQSLDGFSIFMMITALLGGLALFLFGMNFMSKALQRAAGSKMRALLQGVTRKGIIGLLFGTFITMMIQSSSATTVMLVGFVESGLMSFASTISVILGASIGTTITAQLIAFKLTDYALLMIAIGFFINIAFKKDAYKYLGNTILGFGMLFFGMYIMSDAMAPLRTNQVFLDWIIHMENPMIGIGIGFLITALIQSSSAFIGILIVLATQGFLSLESSIALVIGSNLGTSVTAVLSALNTGREAKRVAFTHVFIKVIGVLIFVWWIPYFAVFLNNLSEMFGASANLPRQIANAHTVFNVLVAAIVFPFMGSIAKIAERILPDKKKIELEYQTDFIDKKLISTPAIAISVAKLELLRMSHIVQDMVGEVKNIFLHKQQEVISKVLEYEKQIDFLQIEINKYLIKISRQEIEEERISEVFTLINTAKELEQIGDIVSNNLLKRADKWVNSDKQFSKEGYEEIERYHLRVMKQISRSIEVFDDMNLETAKRMKLKYKKYAQLVEEFERHHYERLTKEVQESIETSKLHLELLSMLKVISNHATNIARIHLNWTKKE